MRVSQYTGSGASHVEVAEGSLTGLSGATHPGQSLTLNSALGSISATATSGFTNGGQLTFDCPIAGCAGIGPVIALGSSTLVNTGTYTVTSRVTGNGGIQGGLTNTGTVQIDGVTSHRGSTGPTAVLLNQGDINLANGAAFTSTGQSCGDTSVQVINDTGGEINATGSGTLNFTYYAQGAGTTSGPNPVTMSCGNLNYTGGGASRVHVVGGGNISGNIAAGQTMALEATNVSAAVSFTNAGTITFPAGGSAQVVLPAGQTLTNTGTMSVGALSNSFTRELVNGPGGTLTLADDATLRTFGTGLTNQGTIAIGASALLQVDAAYAQSAGTATLNGTSSGTPATLLAGFGATLTGGTLGGIGRLQGNLTNSGAVSPGWPRPRAR